MTAHSTFLKERHARLPAVLEEVDRHLQQITADAYRRASLVANDVLSRNTSSNALLRNVLWGVEAERPGGFSVIRSLAQYYVRSLVHFLSYVLTCSVQWTMAGRSTVALDDGHYVIDTFVLQENVRRDGRYQERFMPGLTAALLACGRRAVILPRFYGSLGHPRRVAELMRVLRRSGETFLTEFDLLRWSDLAGTLWFILRYPVDVLMLAARLGSGTDAIDRLVGVELQATLAQVTFTSHLRYRVGRRLGERARGSLRVISWFENQVSEKNFFRGVKATAPSSVIFGCQPFAYCPPLINARIAESDTALHVTPDVVLVGGPAYMRTSPTVPHRLGPSFRYAGLWSAPIDWAQKRETAVFLPYDEQLARDIVSVGGAADELRRGPIAVRSHPSASPGRLPDLPAAWHYSDRPADDLLRRAGIVITSESGSAVEAAALGCSVVIVASQSTFTSNPMLQLGRGEIWQLVFDGDELDTAYRELWQYRADHPDRLQALAVMYREAFFVEPTLERIAEAFNISQPTCAS